MPNYKMGQIGHRWLLQIAIPDFRISKRGKSYFCLITSFFSLSLFFLSFLWTKLLLSLLLSCYCGLLLFLSSHYFSQKCQKMNKWKVTTVLAPSPPPPPKKKGCRPLTADAAVSIISGLWEWSAFTFHHSGSVTRDRNITCALGHHAQLGRSHCDRLWELLESCVVKVDLQHMHSLALEKGYRMLRRKDGENKCNPPSNKTKN